MAEPEVPWRCTVCGSVTSPDRYKTQLDPRFATGYCAVYCHDYRALIRAATVEKATEGYHALQAERERKKAARDELKHQKEQMP